MQDGVASDYSPDSTFNQIVCVTYFQVDLISSP